MTGAPHSQPPAQELVTMGQVVGVYGVRGWVKVYSHTREREGILAYRRWWLKLPDGWRRFEIEDGRRQGQGVVAQLQGVADRSQAAVLIGADIAVERRELPVLPEGQYYWAQLEGLTVRNLEGVELGTVSHLFVTGANDVLVVTGERERWIPYIPDVIREVDLESGVLVADWDADF
ncbi:MAG TPA: ribosome maturation factor RimM [Acidiferrobacterales bacterium]